MTARYFGHVSIGRTEDHDCRRLEGVAGKVEQIGDGIVDGDEMLKLARRLEVLHDPLPSSNGLMGIFRSIVKPLCGRCSTLGMT